MEEGSLGPRLGVEVGFPFKGDWIGVGPQPGAALTNWAPSFTLTLSHLLLPICSSTPFLAKAKNEGWGDCQFHLPYQVIK